GIWCAVRPHSLFRTPAVLVCDLPVRLAETMAIAALIQASVAKLYQLHSRNQSYCQYGRALVMENKFRASRYGLDGMLIDFGKEAEVPMRQLMLEYLEFIDDVVDGLGSRSEINYIYEILRQGTGADRQLRVFEQ